MRKSVLRAAVSGRGLAEAVSICLVVLGMTAGEPAKAASRGSWPNDIERPPTRYAAGPTQYGETTERRFSDLAELQAFCNLYLGKPGRGAYEACYIPAMDLVVLPDARAWPDAVGRQALREHEWAHARGWRHPLAQSTASTKGK